MTSIGIHLTYHDGTNEWYDPVDEDEFDVNQNDKQYVIFNGCYTYIIPKDKVANVRKYQLCDECGYEFDTRHNNTCSKSYDSF